MAEEYGVFTDTPIAVDTSYARLGRRHAADGVVPTGPDAGAHLAVTADTTSELTLAPGYAIVGGWFYRTDTPVPVPVPANTASSVRRDLVTIRADTTAGTCQPHIIEGTPGSSSWPAPVRDPAGTWDTVLARYTIAGGAAVVSPGDVDRSVRQWTVPSGAIPCDSGARPPNPWEGMLIYESDTSRVRVFHAGGWRTVSDLGYPTAWEPLTMGAGYSNYGSTGSAPEGRMLAPTRAELRGTIEADDGTINQGAIIARVPSAMRPRNYVRHMAAGYDEGDHVGMRLDIVSRSTVAFTPGQIRVIRPDNYQPSWVSLDGIVYETE
ncbi:hypothetical protein [Streptomonospora salina]|uniref:hypothetical protein n=1 Tax=Streptomonospora salina TaxID=104205 RepID=UPI0031E8FA5E